MIQLLIDNPLLLLFGVAGVGYLIGRINFGGLRLGVAAVLFVGIAVGGLDPKLMLPEVISNLGLVLFVYTVGLSSGPVFFASLRGKGLRDSLVVFGILSFATLLAVLANTLLHLRAAQTAGLFVGSLNNAAALAGVLEYIRTYIPAAARDQMLNETIIGFSLTFPMGVVGTILSINLMRRFWKINYAEEARSLRGYGFTGNMINRSILVTRPEAARETVHELVHNHDWDIIFGRARRNQALFLVQGDQTLQVGDLVSAVGTAEDLDGVAAYLGQSSDERLDLDRSEFDFRRMFVSNPKIAGRRVKELELNRRYGAVITRLRRGDVEMIPHGETVLQLGDRVRVVTRRENMEVLRRLFGDSYRALSEIDVLTFSFGLALGLLLGSIPIPLPGGIVFKLGFAGGPLLVALGLGAAGQVGGVVWNLPYSANLVLRQFGLILLLAAVGTRAGYTFFSTLAQGSTLPILVAGTIITFVTALLTLWIGYRFLKIPFVILVGVVAGVQTQPAVLSFTLEQTGSDLPNIGYANAFPIGLIAKIVLAQVLLLLFVGAA